MTPRDSFTYIREPLICIYSCSVTPSSNRSGGGIKKIWPKEAYCVLRRTWVGKAETRFYSSRKYWVGGWLSNVVEYYHLLTNYYILTKFCLLPQIDYDAISFSWWSTWLFYLFVSKMNSDKVGRIPPPTKRVVVRKANSHRDLRPLTERVCFFSFKLTFSYIAGYF